MIYYNSTIGKYHLRQNVRVLPVRETAALPTKGKVVSYGHMEASKQSMKR